MTVELSGVVLVIVGLQVKHIICDGPLQTLRMVQDKSHYGRPLGVLHAAIHAAGTALVLLLAGLPLTQVGALAVLDGVVHYHVDYVKENTVKANGWKTTDGPYWWAMTTDQALHHMTYVLLVWLAFKP
jgi:Protein of unknown function (DUF3307)